MTRHRVLNWVYALAFVVAAGCGGGGGCGGCGAFEPLPEGALPADQTIEGGLQARITKSGLNTIGGVARALIADALGEGFCIPEQELDVIGIDLAAACFRDQCAGGARGCGIGLRLEDVALSAPDDQTLRLGVTATVPESRVPVRVAILGSCTLLATVDNANFDADVGLGIAGSSGELELQLTRINNLDISGLDLEEDGCGILVNVILDIVDVVADILSSDIARFVVNLVLPLVEDFILSFLPDPLGLEGMLDAGSLVSGISPGTNATMETRIVPGGYVQTASEGLSIGVIAGFNADEDPTTRTPELDSEPALCVPPFAAPDFGKAPHLLDLSPRGNFKLDPADQFLGLPDPANDLVVGVSETFLDLAGHHIVSSGTLCLGVGTELVDQLNLGLVGIIVPSLKELGERGDEPLLLVLRPQRSLDFSIGEGTDDEPILNIGISGLQIDFYAFLFERYVRGFTIELALDVGVDLMMDVDDQGNPAITPVLAGLEADQIDLTAYNAEFLRETEAKLEEVFPAVLDIALPLLTDALGPIALPDLGGFALQDIRFRKVTTSEDDFMALFASLRASSAALARVLPGYVENRVPGGELDKLLQDEPAPVRPVTRARLAKVDTPTPAELADYFARKTDGRLTSVSIEVAPADELGRELEYSWRRKGSLWSKFATHPNGRLVVSTPSFAIQGTHSLEVRARPVGDFMAADLSPVEIAFVTDSLGPRVLRKDIATRDGVLHTPALDLVTAPETLRYAWGAPGAAEPATSWTNEPSIDLTVAEGFARDGWVRVFARDASGNVTVEDVEAPELSFHGTAEGEAGCSCAASGDGGSGPWVLALAVAMILGRRRKSPPARRDARSTSSSSRAVAASLLLMLVGGLIGCDDADTETEPAAPVCTLNEDCAADCRPNEVPVCMDNACSCEPDIAYGDIGRFSEVSAAPNGDAWISAYNSRYGDLMVASFSGSGRVPDDAWEFVDGVPDVEPNRPWTTRRGGITRDGDDVGRYTDIEVNSSGSALVSYHDRTNGSLKFATNASGSWVSHVVDPGRIVNDGDVLESTIAGLYTSLTLRSDDGRPGVAYFVQIGNGDGTVTAELRFASASTNAPTSQDDWTFFLVDTVTYEVPADPGPYTVPDGVGIFASAARRPDQTPLVVYYDSINGDLRLAEFDSVAGAFGQATILDGDGIDTGWYPSVTVDANDVVHVSYLDPTFDDLRYVSSIEASEVVDDGRRLDGTNEDGLPLPVFHFVGDDSTVLATPIGPAIVYQDSTTHELLLARRGVGGVWERKTLAGDEVPFVGGYGFYAAGVFTGVELVISSYVIDQPGSDSWVEVFREGIVVD